MVIAEKVEVRDRGRAPVALTQKSYAVCLASMLSLDTNTTNKNGGMDNFWYSQHEADWFTCRCLALLAGKPGAL